MSNTRTKGTSTDQVHAHSDANPAAEAGMSRDIINIPDNVLQKGIKDYSQDQQDDIQWLFSYATNELANSRDRLCDAMDCDWTTAYRIATGNYSASVASFVSKIQDLNRRVLSSAGVSGLVETFVTRRITDVLDYALAGDIKGGKIVMIVGSSRRGKTETIKEWCRNNNHGRSVYVDCPESGGMRALLTEIAGSCRINKGRSTADMRERVLDSFNRRRILIVDEIARLMPMGRELKTTQFEFIRRLHDKTGCAIALCATPVFEHMMDTSKLHDYLEQLLGRIADPLHIPDRVYRDECRAFLKHFSADQSEELLALTHTIANQSGKLGILFELLHQASAVARRKKEPLGYRHLSAAYERRQNRFTWPKEDK